MAEDKSRESTEELPMERNSVEDYSSMECLEPALNTYDSCIHKVVANTAGSSTWHPTEKIKDGLPDCHSIES